MRNYVIFRAVETKADFRNFHEYRNTMRPPGNVPYVIDNLWEWKRPDGYPNRRYSAFASPTIKLARKSAKEGSLPYKVEFKGRCALGQLMGWEDSKYHPECTKLKSTFLDKIGKNWVNYSMQEKAEVGKLFMPCLTKEEVNYLFETVETLKNIHFYNNVSYLVDKILLNFSNDIHYPSNQISCLYFLPNLF